VLHRFQSGAISPSRRFSGYTTRHGAIDPDRFEPKTNTAQQIIRIVSLEPRKSGSITFKNAVPSFCGGCYVMRWMFPRHGARGPGGYITDQRHGVFLGSQPNATVECAADKPEGPRRTAAAQSLSVGASSYSTPCLFVGAKRSILYRHE